MSESRRTISVPEAGREFFGLGREAAYAAAKRGEIPTLKFGRILRVPVTAVEQMLADAALRRHHSTQ